MTARATYVLRNGELVEKKTGAVMAVRPGPVAAPMVMKDIPDYRSPIDGRMIGSRSTRREDLKRNNCVEWDPALSPTRGKPEFKNARFAKKHGLKLSENAHAAN
jgi:hypothetical protein